MKYEQPKREPGMAAFVFEDGPWMGQMKLLPAREVREFWWAPIRDVIHVMPPIEPTIFTINPEDSFPVDDLVTYWDHQYRFQRGRTRDGWRFFWHGPHRDDWGPKRQLEEAEHQLRYLQPVWQQLKSQMYPPPRLLWVFPEYLAPQVSVYRGMQVIHAAIPCPVLSIKPDFPTWSEISADIARIRRRLDEY